MVGSYIEYNYVQQKENMTENLTDERGKNGDATPEQKMRELLLYGIQEKLNNLSFQQLEELYKGMLAKEQAAQNEFPPEKTKVLRELLIAAYGADGVRRFAADYANPVYQEFPRSALTSDIANALIQYFHEQDKIPQLLAKVKKDNSYQVGRFMDAVIQAGVLPADSPILNGLSSRT